MRVCEAWCGPSSYNCLVLCINHTKMQHCYKSCYEASSKLLQEYGLTPELKRNAFGRSKYNTKLQGFSECTQ